MKRPVNRGPLALSLALVMMAGAAPGCGHNEEEWQGKLNEIKNLEGRLKKAEEERKKCNDDLASSKDDNTTLRAENDALKGKTGDLSKQTAEQLREIERLRRQEEKLKKLVERITELRKKLQGLTDLGINVTVRNNRMVIQLPGDILFDSGKVELRKEGQDMLRKVADAISKDSNLLSKQYQVSGHTDDKPYAGEFKDNWGLSLMRARDVLKFLVDPAEGKTKGGGLPSKHWSAAGYADTDPLVPNADDASRKKNRRVELVVLPDADDLMDATKLLKD